MGFPLHFGGTPIFGNPQKVGSIDDLLGSSKGLGPKQSWRTSSTDRFCMQPGNARILETSAKAEG